MPMMVAGIVLSVAVIGAGGFYLTKGRSTPSATSPAAPPVASASVPNAAPALPEPHTQASAVVPNAPTSGSSSAPAAPVASTPVRVAGMAPSSTVPVVPAPQAPSRAGATSGAGALAAKRTLDSLTNALDPANPDEAAAHAAIPVLRGLLPRLASAEDSTWAEIRLAEAHLLVSDSRQACVAIRIARTTARSKAQRDAVQRYDIMLSCGDL
jgi:serine/threonine-protein kinase